MSFRTRIKVPVGFPANEIVNLAEEEDTGFISSL